MTFDDLWAAACYQNPEILNGDGTVRLTIEGLHKAMKLAWEQGRKEEGRARNLREHDGLEFLKGMMGL